MIRFVRSKDNTGVYIKIEPGGALKGLPSLDFYREGASPIEMILLCEQVRTQLGALMADIRRISYLRGWRDAKSKCKKQEWFAECAEVLDWERKDAGERP